MTSRKRDQWASGANTSRQEMSPRVSVSLKAEIVDSEGMTIEAVLLDLSSNGFRLKSSGELFSGERVQLRVGKAQPVPAEIKWVAGNEAGGVFVES